MQIVQQAGNGANDGFLQQIDKSYLAARVSPRALEHCNADGSVMGGHFRAQLSTGTTVSVGANGVLAAFQWTNQTKLAVIKRITAQAMVAATITTLTAIDLEGIVARPFTAAYTGGTQVVPGVGLKVRTSHGNSAVADLRVATTAALGAAAAPNAPVLDTVGFGAVQFEITAVTALAAGTIALPKVLYSAEIHGECPLVLAQNEGFVLREISAGPVTGGIKWIFGLEWAEVPSY